MDKETLRMQMLSGIITEGEYAAAINQEVEETEKDSLNEHFVAGGIVGVGAINQIPSRAKADYEDAFEHFLGQKYNLNEDETSDMEEEVAEETGLYEEEVEENSLEDYFKKIKLKFPELGTKEFNDLASAYFGGNPNNSEEGKEEVEEYNLGPNEIASLEPEGRFWIVSWRGMDGPKEKVFTDEDEARAFMNTLYEGKEVEEAMVNPNTSDRVSYLENTLNHVWNMGKGNNSIDFEDMAKSIVNDMFGDLEEGKEVEEPENY